MKLNLSSPLKGALPLCVSLVLLFSTLDLARGAEQCYYCATCTGSMVKETLTDIFGVIGTENKVDDYILEASAGATSVMAWPDCAEKTEDITKAPLADQAAGTQCMATYVTVKDDTPITNETTNVMVSCIILGGVSQLFKAFNASSGMTADDFKANINKLTTAGLVADLTGLESDSDVEDVSAGAVFCSADNCNGLPENDKATMTSTVSGYNTDYEDSTSQAYKDLKAAGELIAEKMCETTSGCSKSGFEDFKKVAAASSSRVRRSSSFDTQVIIFIEATPGSMPTETELKDLYKSALTAAKASGGVALLDSFSETIVVAISEGGNAKQSSTMRATPIGALLLAILCILGSRLYA